MARFSATSPSYLHDAATARFEMATAAPELLQIPPMPLQLPLPLPANQPRPNEIALTSATSEIREPIVRWPDTGTSAGSSSGGPTGERQGQTQLFGVPGAGTRFVYVFDRSASMEGVRLAAAKQELIASLHALESRHQFQVVFYGQQPEALHFGSRGEPRLIMADERNKTIAERFIRGIIADGPTSHLPALEMALSMQPDVIFFLTDASEPQMSALELARVRRLNRGTVINTIEFGAGPRGANYNFLQALAAENGGQHGYVDVGRLLR
jgi:hypothetical protein